MSVNKVILLGRLGQDPELKYTANSVAVTTVSIATSEKTKKGEETEWHSVVFFGKQAEAVGKYMTKGRYLFVEGRNKTKSWEDKDGNKKYKTEVIASSFNFVDSRAASDKEDRPQQSFTNADYKITAQPTMTHDDIPF